MLVIQTLYVMGYGSLVPLEPGLCQKAFGEHCFTINGYLKTVDNISSMVVLPVLGLATDRFGPRKVLGYCLLAASVSSAYYTLFNSPLGFYVVEHLATAMGGGVSAFATTMMASMAVMSSTEQRTTTMAFVIAGFGGGQMLAGRLASFIEGLHPLPISPSHGEARGAATRLRSTRRRCLQ